MTFKEYYLEHQNTGGFFTIDEFTTAYPSIDRASNAQLMTMLSSKIVAIAGHLNYEPVWSYPHAINYELEKVSFLKQYPLEKLYEVVKAGFNERETESKRDLAITLNNDNSTVNTFKSFPQVTGTELSANNKVAESETVNSGEAETTNEAERDLTRQHNSVEATEYLAHFMANTLNKIARDYVQLTALDGIYTQPEDLDD